MSAQKLIEERERIRRFAKSIGSIKPYSVPPHIGYSDRQAWCGPLGFGRKAVKIAIFNEKMAFRRFMSEALRKDVQ